MNEHKNEKIWIKIYFKDGRYDQFKEEWNDEWETIDQLIDLIVDCGFHYEKNHSHHLFIPPHAIERIIITKRDTTEERGDF